MGRIIRFDLDRHQETQTLLPWYVSRQLEGEELARVEAHLRECSDCQAELQLERRLVGAVADLPFDVDQGWTELSRHIAAQRDRARPAAAIRKALSKFDGAGWAVAAQFLLVLALVGLVLPLSRPPQYQALGAAPQPAASGDVIVMFRPEATAQDLTRALRTSGARLVDGPTAADAYVLQVPTAKRAAALAGLRADAAVTMAEPIDPVERP